MIINSMTLVSPTFEPLGLCLDPLVATVNHSCDPNAVITFDGPILSLRSSRAIESDEEISISYIDCTNPYHMRQEELRDRYFFSCRCGRCQRESSLGDDPFHSPTNQDAEKQCFDMLAKAKKETSHQASMMECLQATQLLKATRPPWPLGRQPWPSIRLQLVLSYLTAKQWTAAVSEMLVNYFYIDPKLFPMPWHPVRVVHTWSLGLQILNLATLSASEPDTVASLAKYELDYSVVLRGLLREMEGNVNRSHGRDSSFAGVVRRKIEEVNTDTRAASLLPLSRQTLEEEWSKLRRIADAAPP